MRFNSLTGIIFIWTEFRNVGNGNADRRFQFPDGNYFYLDYAISEGANLEVAVMFQFPDGNYFYLDSGPLETLWLKGFRGNLREPTVKGPLFTMLW